MNDILDTKIKNKNKKITTLATKAELKVEQNKIEKLQTYDDSSLFIDQSYFGHNRQQNFLIHERMYKTFKIPAGLTDKLQNESLKSCQVKKISFLLYQIIVCFQNLCG